MTISKSLRLLEKQVFEVLDKPIDREFREMEVKFLDSINSEFIRKKIVHPYYFVKISKNKDKNRKPMDSVGSDIEFENQDKLENLVLTARRGECSANYYASLHYLTGKDRPRDVDESFRYLHLAASCGDPRAYKLLARQYYSGVYTKRDFGRAKYYLEKSLAANEVDDLYLLGQVHWRDGRGSDISAAIDYFVNAGLAGDSRGDFLAGIVQANGNADFDRAFEHFLTAADKGGQRAGTIVSIMSIDGIGTPKNLQFATDILRDSGNLGDVNPTDLFTIGSALYQGTLVKKDHLYAKKVLQAADRNIFLVSDSQTKEELVKNTSYLLALLMEGAQDPSNREMFDHHYHYARAAERDHKQAQAALKRLDGVAELENPAVIELIQRASMGDARAQFELGTRYASGLQVVKNIGKSNSLIESAAQSGFKRAQKYLSVINPFKIGDYSVKELDRSLHWENYLIDAKEPTVANFRGQRFFINAKSERDCTEAFYWMEKAVEWNGGLAFLTLPNSYRDGCLGNQNHKRALELFLEHARRSKSRVAKPIADYYRFGAEGVEIDFKKAVEWYQKADMKDEDSQWVALQYWTGEHLMQDKIRAAGLAALPAYKGFPIAQYVLGLSYLDGSGKNGQSYHLAQMWMSRALEGGYEPAREGLQRVYAEGADYFAELESLMPAEIQQTLH